MTNTDTYKLYQSGSIALYSLLLPSCEVLDGINRPTWYFPDICADSRDVAQQEEGRKSQCEPNDIAVYLFYCHHHHGVQEIMSYVLTEIKMSHIQVGKGKLLSVTHHIFVHKVRENGGINAITCRSCQIHVEDVEYEQAHEELFKTWDRFV